MAKGGAIIGLAPWLATAPGAYLLDWEQAHLDVAVGDLFGFHALQLGLAELDALRANRMPHRWVGVEGNEGGAGASMAAVDGLLTASTRDASAGLESVVGAPGEGPRPRAAVSLCCHFDALPFDAASLDLVVLPHALERARDPHLTLREVERVLVPEGRVVIVGFNSASLWALRQRLGRMRRRVTSDGGRDLFLPRSGDFIGYRRLRDWLRLLSFEVEAGRFGCYRMPFKSETWLARCGWMDTVGERWWPVFGAVYFVVAVKRVRGMRLVGLARRQQAAARQAAPAPVIASHREREVPVAVELEQ